MTWQLRNDNEASVTASGFSYGVYQTKVVTNLVMQGLSSASTESDEVIFNVADARRPRLEPRDDWFHHYRRNGSPRVSCARRAGGFLVRYHGVADFLVSAGGDEIVCHALTGASDFLIADVFLKTILPLVLNRRGRDAIHAGAVAIGGAAVAFSGISMAGKSTLVAYFRSLGYPVLTDDYLAFDSTPGGVSVYPGLAQIRLWADAVEGMARLSRGPLPSVYSSDKLIVPLGSESVADRISPLPLTRIFWLIQTEHDESSRRNVEIDRPSSAEAFIHLTQNSHRLELRDASMLGRQADLFSRIAREHRVRRLRRAFGFDLLPLTVERILEDLEFG